MIRDVKSDSRHKSTLTPRVCITGWDFLQACLALSSSCQAEPTSNSQFEVSGQTGSSSDRQRWFLLFGLSGPLQTLCCISDWQQLKQGHHRRVLQRNIWSSCKVKQATLVDVLLINNERRVNWAITAGRSAEEKNDCWCFLLVCSPKRRRPSLNHRRDAPS